MNDPDLSQLSSIVRPTIVYISVLLFTFYRSRRLPSSVTVRRRSTILICRSILCRSRNTGNTSIGTYIFLSG
ncbi:hypothetical protein RDI58_021514 [Solanum bulbocastanum]|uniref:Uncharacterized protein n=1 Tax=Solanum bulbocastanum TaxID=147425 RepID=A0AAN8T0H0_SOLBU